MVIMRFKKGSEVEVLNRRDVPSYSWCPAEIVSSDGHTYLVRYYRPPANILERVHRKGIRPCPPSIECLRAWGPGDVVEVLNDYSWNLAQVLRVVGRDLFDVRLLGSSVEFRAHSSDVRARHSWQDNKWVVISKNSREFMGRSRNKLGKDGKLICQNISCFEDDDCAGDSFVMIDSDNVPSVMKGMRKRPTMCSPPAETCMRASRKTRTIEMGGRRHRLVAENSTLLHTCFLKQQVDAVASPHKMLGEKYMHSSLNNKTTQFSEIQRWEGVTADDNCHNSSSLEPIDIESVSSSVGSCSVSESPFRSSHCLVNGLIKDVVSCSYDYEISSHSGRDLSLPTKEVVAEGIHCVELHAYRKTLGAFYASGPISWEQEALMTNLRLMLHVSNDEHLAELRKFMSAEKNMLFR